MLHFEDKRLETRYVSKLGLKCEQRINNKEQRGQGGDLNGDSQECN